MKNTEGSHCARSRLGPEKSTYVTASVRAFVSARSGARAAACAIVYGRARVAAGFAVVALMIVSATLVMAGDDHADESIDAIVLSETSVRNLGLELAEAVEVDFEEVVFAIGRIDHIPSKHAVVSSRIAGRAIDVNVIPGDRVKRGQVLVRVESRLPGNPPPVIALEAPISGTVIQRHVRQGEPVEPANELLDITDLSEVWAVAKVPEQEAGRVRVGSKARIRVAALPDELFEGELIRFGTEADAATGTLEAIFRLSNPELHLRPGMRAEFSIITSFRPNVMAVPRDAVQGDPTNRVVYVEHFELPNAFLKSPVQTGARNDRYIEIRNGLFPADRVVTKGAYFLGSAGAGDMSLKEALDLAHGHEHNEDGSEMTPEQQAAREAESQAASGRGRKRQGPLALFFGVTTVLFGALLLLSGMKHVRDGRLISELSDLRSERRRGDGEDA